LSWIDKGLLEAHRTPGGHRRVERDALVAFLKSREMPIPRELADLQKLLIIDDDVAMLKALKRSLSGEAPELEIEIAESAVDGLLKVGTFRPDAVLLDAYMPGMNGVEVCVRIRAAPETARIRVIALTGQPSPHLAAAFLEAGAVACLTKPLELAQLLSVLQQAERK
jgi:CheY-like chemotaxis protein